VFARLTPLLRRTHLKVSRSHGLSNRSSKQTSADPAAGIVPLRSLHPLKGGETNGSARPQSILDHRLTVFPSKDYSSPEASISDARSRSSSAGVALLIVVASTVVILATLLIQGSREHHLIDPQIATVHPRAGTDAKPVDRDLAKSRSAPDAPDAVSTLGYVWPTIGTVTQEFGCTDFDLEPWNAEVGCRFHYGIDIANEPGTPILAAHAGRVVDSGWAEDGYGYRVVLSDADGVRTLYGHLCCAPGVIVGQEVEQGEQIGLMGTTGASSGPHLHFAIEIDGAYVNPRNYLPNFMPEA
jgi:murein DD-endopeptidase MepM/ murein hydrolase activator NlpD